MSTALAESLIERFLGQCLGCLLPRHENEPMDELGGRSGVHREMKIAHCQQPHLVPPMKLVFYDDMPSTPTLPHRSSSRLSQWRSSGRGVASRTSNRASQTLKRRRFTSTSRPPLPDPGSPVQRVEAFRPLQLSIYLPDNRLSDLPMFDLANFDDSGEIQLPPKAVTRAQSEAILTRTGSTSSQRKAYKSMVDDRSLQYWRRRSPSLELPEASAEPSTNRQSVVWNSLPGLPVLEPPVQSTIVTSTSTPPRTTPAVPMTQSDVMTLTFPPIDREQIPEPLPQVPLTPPQPLRRTVISTPNSSPLAVSPPSSSRLHTPTTRVSQWLQRTNTASSSSSASTSLSSRRHRLRKSSSATASSKLSISAPIPISDQRSLTMLSSTSTTVTAASASARATNSVDSHSHSRTRTISSSTVASTALSNSGLSMDGVSISTYTTMTTAPVPSVPKSTSRQHHQPQSSSFPSSLSNSARPQPQLFPPKLQNSQAQLLTPRQIRLSQLQQQERQDTHVDVSTTTGPRNHWTYLPKSYADVWKRETVVGEKDVVGVAF